MTQLIDTQRLHVLAKIKGKNNTHCFSRIGCFLVNASLLFFTSFSSFSPSCLLVESPPPQPEIFHFSESTSGNFIEGEREREEPCRHMKSCLLTLYSTPAKTSHYMRQGPPSNTSVLVYIFFVE